MGKRVKRDARDITVLVRASDRPGEALHDALEKSYSDGLWADGYNVDWVFPNVIDAIQDAGKMAFIVSPELHNRPLQLELWHNWQNASGICTDFPHLLDSLYGQDRVNALKPKEPWW